MEYDRADKEVAEMSKIKVNEQRAVDEFQELTAIDAPSFGERQMADRLIVYHTPSKVCFIAIRQDFLRFDKGLV